MSNILNREHLSYTTAELAEVAGGILEGKSDVLIHGVAETKSVRSGEITYAVNDKYVEQLLKVEAGCAIIPESTAENLEFGFPVIRSANPYLAFALVLRCFEKKRHRPDVLIHKSAVVASTAKVGDGTLIGACTVIDESAVIGRDCSIGSNCSIGQDVVIGNNVTIAANVTIRDDSVIGDRVIIHSGTVIGTDGYGFVFADGNYEKIPQIGIVEIMDDVEIGSLVCIDRATIGKTVIGRGCKIDNLVQIGHNVVLGENCAIVSQSGLAGSTVVGSNCRFAGQTATSGHLTIGDNTTVAGRGVVVKSLEANSYVSGFPAKRHSDELKIKMALPKLPDLLRKIRQLEKQLDKLRDIE